MYLKKAETFDKKTGLYTSQTERPKTTGVQWLARLLNEILSQRREFWRGINRLSFKD